MDIDHTKQLPSTVEGNSLESFTSPLGRPSKLDNSRVEELVKWLKLGYYIEDACTMAGIAKQTYYNWVAKAESEEEQNI